MKVLAFSPAAEADIDGIWDYSADNWGPEQADRYTDEIRDACHALASGRKQGRVVDVRPRYLKISTGSHVIYYRDQGDRLEIVRVLHSRMDSNRHL
ncbi:MAG TPA: type II toxin-antitoxin system RelE/ParE family toxin [Candidatus Propionivibrio aalborgensis]|nr:type II toxin-antitoxin system RelE/ParE family toxin [Candidatus Propionivibrio aalborgensis]